MSHPEPRFGEGTHDLSPIFQSVSHAYQLCNKVSKEPHVLNFFAQALLLLFKKRRKVSGQKMRTAYRIVRLLISNNLLRYILLNHEFKQSTTNPNKCTHMVPRGTCLGLDKFSDYSVLLIRTVSLST